MPPLLVCSACVLFWYHGWLFAFWLCYLLESVFYLWDIVTILPLVFVHLFVFTLSIRFIKHLHFVLLSILLSIISGITFVSFSDIRDHLWRFSFAFLHYVYAVPIIFNKYRVTFLVRVEKFYFIKVSFTVSFSLVVSVSLPPVSRVSPLNVSRFTLELQHHPDQTLVSVVLQGFI